jgi:glutathione S-transferase
VGRHDHAHIIRLGILDLDTVDALLGDRPFFFGETPTDIDATVFGFMALTHWTPVPSPVWDHFRALPRLGAYCERMLARYYSGPAASALGAPAGAQVSPVSGS